MVSINKIIGKIISPFFRFWSRRRNPVKGGIISIQGISNEIIIQRDEYGIPIIKANNKADLYFGQGFAHAQDRLWQMELNKRTATGQLSELFGELALETDELSRTFGFLRLGEKDWENYGEEEQEIIQAYTKGVNAYLDSEIYKKPLEFTLISQDPTNWKPKECLALMRFMTWQLSHAWHSKIVRANLVEKLGEEVANELNIIYPKENPSILHHGNETNMYTTQKLLEAFKGPFLSPTGGSNSMVIAGDYTSTGKPLLANDVHLALSTPGIWYQNHLSLPGISQTGVSLPGVPLVLIGQNSFIAWGITLSYTDAADVYLEKVDYNSMTYQFKDENLSLQVIEESINVKDYDDPVNIKIYYTNHGVILPKKYFDSDTDIISNSLAIRDVSLEPLSNLGGWIKLNYAKDWDEFVHAMQEIDAPQLSIIYSDEEGNIGYWCTGKVPLRPNSTYRVPIPGWNGDHEWDGFIPFEEMPHMFNPKDGYIVTANHKVIDDSYPHDLGNVWMNGYRANRLTTLIKEKIAKEDKITPESINEFMKDITCIPGIEFVDILNNIRPPDFSDEKYTVAYKILLQWDGKMRIDSIGASLYEVTRYYCYINLISDKVDQSLIHNTMGTGLHPLLYPANEYFGYDTISLLKILRENNSSLLREYGGREKLLKTSFIDAYNSLEGKHGKDILDWEWGKIHHAIFPHAFDIQPPMNHVFNPKSIAIPGNTDTPFQTAMYAESPFNNNAWSPSYRFIAMSGDLDNTRGISVPGQSGVLGTKHYDDLIRKWADGKYINYKLAELRDKDFSESSDDLNLIPT